MAQGCLLLSDTDVFFPIALSEPYSCVIAAVRANYHGTVVHEMDIVEGGNTAVLGGTGPMGSGHESITCWHGAVNRNGLW